MYPLRDRTSEIQTVKHIPGLRRASQVQPKQIEWLWESRMPLGHVTVLEGDPGEGKSFITHAIAAGLSIGELPDRAGIEPLNSLLLTAEDDLNSTVRPRLEQLGADLERVYLWSEMFQLHANGISRLRDMIETSSARFVCIDPIVAFLPDAVDPNRAHRLRKVLGPLSALARDLEVTVIIVRHLNKGDGKAIYRGQGSIDYAAAARSVLLAGHDPDDPDRKALNQIKNSFGKLDAGSVTISPIVPPKRLTVRIHSKV